MYNHVLFVFRDNPNTDIIGANLYDRYLKKMWNNKDTGSDEETELPQSRVIPKDTHLRRQSVRSVESVLVGTGVYSPESEENKDDEVYHGHRDIVFEPELAKPSIFVPDVYHGIQHILEHEGFKVNGYNS